MTEFETTRLHPQMKQAVFVSSAKYTSTPVPRLKVTKSQHPVSSPWVRGFLNSDSKPSTAATSRIYFYWLWQEHSFTTTPHFTFNLKPVQFPPFCHPSDRQLFTDSNSQELLTSLSSTEVHLISDRLTIRLTFSNPDFSEFGLHLLKYCT